MSSAPRKGSQLARDSTAAHKQGSDVTDAWDEGTIVTEVWIWGSLFEPDDAEEDATREEHRERPPPLFYREQLFSKVKVSRVSAGRSHYLAVSTQGRVFSCGSSRHGQLGLGSGVERCAEPCEVAALSHLFVTSATAGPFNSSAITARGKLFAWGKAMAEESSDEPLPQRSGPALKGLFVTEVAFGHAHACAIAHDPLTGIRSLFSWGSGEHGQLGHGDLRGHSSPRLLRLPDALEPQSVSCGARHSALKLQTTPHATKLRLVASASCGDSFIIAVTKRGAVYSWGVAPKAVLGPHSKGQLKKAAVSSAATQLLHPAKLSLPIDKFERVECGSRHTVVLLSNHRALSWGDPQYSKLGHSSDSQGEPAFMLSLRHREVLDISCGLHYTIAIVAKTPSGHQAALPRNISTTKLSLAAALHVAAKSSGSISQAPVVVDHLNLHNFQPAILRRPTWCTVCGQFIWAILQQGLRCKRCHLSVHHTCSTVEQAGFCNEKLSDTHPSTSQAHSRPESPKRAALTMPDAPDPADPPPLRTTTTQCLIPTNGSGSSNSSGSPPEPKLARHVREPRVQLRSQPSSDKKVSRRRRKSAKISDRSSSNTNSAPAGLLASLHNVGTNTPISSPISSPFNSTPQEELPNAAELLLQELHDIVAAASSPPSPGAADLDPRMGAAKRVLGLEARVTELEAQLSEVSRQLRKAWEIDADEVDMTNGQKLGTGACGEVWRAKYRGQDVAVKILNKRVSSRLEADFDHELSILREFKSPYTVLFYGVCKRPHPCLVMEFASRGSLRRVLKLPPSHEHLDWHGVINYLFQIAQGLYALHSWGKGIIHRDIKPLNILVTQNYQLKIADLGTARLLADLDDENLERKMQQTLFKMRGTSFYICPELITREKATPKSDIYSFGITMWEVIHRLLTGSHRDPYYEYPDLLSHEITLLNAVAHRHVRPTIPASCPPPVVAIIEKCWAPLPNDRPAASELVEDLVDLQNHLNQSPDDWEAAVLTHSGSEDSESDSDSFQE